MLAKIPGIKPGLVLILVGNFYACSYTPDSDPGQCRITCSKAVIGGNDEVFSMKVKSGKSGTQCAPSAVGATIGPFNALFLIGEAIIDENKAVVGTRPVPNISIEPVLIGNRPGLGNTNDDDIRYQGLYTLQDNWCSDACGVVKLDIASVCPGVGTSNDLSVQIHSGALFSEFAIFPISTVAPE